MKILKWLNYVLAAAVLLTAAVFLFRPKIGLESDITIRINHAEAELNGKPIFQSGRIYVPMFSLGHYLSFFTWMDSSNDSIRVLVPGQEVIMKVGESQVKSFGKTIQLEGAPIIHNNALYVPLQLFSSVLQVPMSWESRTGTVDITYNTPYIFAKEKGAAFWFRKSIGDLYMSTGNKPFLLKNINLKTSDTSILTASQISNDSYMLQIEDDTITGYVIYKAIIQHHKVAISSLAQYKRSGNTLKSIDRVGDLWVMIDDSTLKLVASDGTIKTSYSAQEIFGENDTFTVEEAFDDYLLVRPSRQKILYLFNRKTKESIALYKHLMTSEEQASIDSALANGLNKDGDSLYFNRIKGDVLYFTRRIAGANPNSYTYQLK
ncbi:copper amine oxidase N-terminal domain-containing protein [Paenibacillus alvei]|uniref:copper amine oxidase N-terminal domain-containing protein n=1 Tax=Paenibacillus alvei TaxID=44250 RepID=UPI0003868AD0|nr:copper amine oxidase N-terminal domain-containing protein [Paenibacillus alvei]EPY09729.1 copper amine oxidase domain-containing protein [Paenibacillus alvei A6-6i-x]